MDRQISGETVARLRIFVEHLYRLDYKVEILERRMKAANDRCRRHRREHVP